MASRKIEVEIVGDSKSLEAAFSRSQKSGKQFGSGMDKVAKTARVAGLAIFTALAVTAKVGFDELSDSQAVLAQTTAGIESTGGAAKASAKHIEAYASALSEMSGIDDEVIQQGTNLLLTFTKIRNEVGKGNKILDRATLSALNLSVKGFGSVDSTSKMLGKALQDPIKGMTALGKAGVTFTAGQKKAITSMVEHGKLLEAQKLILKEVETQVGGAAKAYGDTLPGQLAKAKNAFAEMAASLMLVLLPAMLTVSQKLQAFAGFLQEHPKQAKALIIALGALATALIAASVAQTALNIAMLANPAGAVIVGLVALGVAVAAIIVKWDQFKRGLEKVWAIISRAPISVFGHQLADLGGVVRALAGTFNGMANAVQGAIDKVRGLLEALHLLDKKKGSAGFGDKNLGGGNFGSGRAYYPEGQTGHNAQGVRNWRGGWSMVGEEGPEMVNLPRGSDVIPNHELGGITVVFNSTFPPTERQAHEAARGVARGLRTQGTRPRTRFALGV